MVAAKFDNITQVVGNTPVIRTQKIGRHTKAEIYLKLEYLNPGGSVKDRIAFQIVEDAEREGLLLPGGTIVEATSGNTGMGLALAAAVKGYKCIFVMPDKMSQEKIASLRAFGAKVVITPTNVAPEDPRSYYCVSRRIAQETPGAFYANQYHNQSNPRAHYLTTGPEIWEQMGGQVDVFVSAAGTGGTISGTGRYLKEKNPNVQVVAADPIGSLYYDYFKTGKLTEPHSYKVEGFGEDFLPTTMHFQHVDEVVRVTDKECFDYTRRLVREEGVYTGGSSGGALAAAVKYAERMDRPMKIVVIMCDSASRYLSKIFNEDWMREHGFLNPDPHTGTVGDLLAAKGRENGPVITASPKTTVREVVSTMKAKGFSQVPVMEGGKIVGIVHESDVLTHLLAEGATPSDPIEKLIVTDFAIVEPTNGLGLISQFFNQKKVVLVMDRGALSGIVTKIDFIDYVSKLT
jgi:cystathionine beta-synthase